MATVEDLHPIATTLSAELDAIYSTALVRQFVGGTVEDFLPLRRLVEAGWTLPQLLELIGAIRDDGELAMRPRTDERGNGYEERAILLPYERWEAVCEVAKVGEGRG